MEKCIFEDECRIRDDDGIDGRVLERVGIIFPFHSFLISWSKGASNCSFVEILQAYLHGRAAGAIKGLSYEISLLFFSMRVHTCLC